MKRKKTWAIECYNVAFPNCRSIIEPEEGSTYANLRTTARRMGYNGTGDRYRVIESFNLPKTDSAA